MDDVRRLIASDHLEKAIAVLLADGSRPSAELRDELTSHQAQLARTRKESRRGLMSADGEAKARTRVRYAVLDLLTALPQESVDVDDPASAQDTVTTSGTQPSSPSPTVFISYNHADADAADRLRSALEAAGIGVRIDRAAMGAGEDIESFIRDSIRETDVTLAVISQRSLLSAWVAMEATTTFVQESVSGRYRFIACYLEDDFFRHDFLIDATDRIDERIAEIDALIPEYAERKIDTVDLNGEKSRLFALRNSLGDFLKRLRGSLTLDVRDGAFEESVSRIVETIHG